MKFNIESRTKGNPAKNQKRQPEYVDVPVESRRARRAAAAQKRKQLKKKAR